MRGNSRINKEEQVKVVIRLRPQQSQSKYSKCVYLSDQDQNELVVETDNKKEIFMFDHVAHQSISQQEIYRMIGQECVLQTFEGYNCCIFAYGQTGAGKTYSVLGSLNDLTLDPYCETRGILPRILEDIFQEGKNTTAERLKIICSYMEIYNEQIFDLLSTDKRIHQIRQDAKRGVFVEGLIQKKVASYKSAVSLLLQGEKTRRMATTMMNNQSSRSHAIFTILIQSQFVEEDTIKSKKAKLHIIDLAGSERVKHTNVQGERLREGCNINRSLHVLGNVINSLVESAKRKKHIPYRDSKLTHYLKDSLGGNSITKLLANIHTNKNYFGDTLSTLMFAKRAKILKMKVQLNQTSVGNFDALRKQVRRLRQQLAQARYFKTDGKMSDKSYEPEFETTLQKFVSEHEQVAPPKEDTLRVLEQNQLHFKALIEIYQEHMKTCLSSSHFQRKQNINIVNQWKKLQKRNISLTHLVKRLPSFAKIYRQNLLLKQENNKQLKQVKRQGVLLVNTLKNNELILKQQLGIPHQQIQKAIAFYEKVLDEVQLRFKETIQNLQKNYLELQSECKLKDKKIKDLRKKKEYPPQIEQLKNQNEYLHLSILNLQNQIAKLQQNEQKIKIQLKQSKRSSARKEKQDQNDLQRDELEMIYEHLIEIRNQAQRQAQLYDVQRSQMQLNLQKMQAQFNKILLENNKLRLANTKTQSKSKSKRKNSHQTELGNQLKTPLQSNQPKEEILFSSKTIKFQNDQLKSLQQQFTKQTLVLKMDIKRKQKEINDLKKQLQHYINGDKKLQDQFGKPLEEIIEQYRSFNGRKILLQSKSVRVIQQSKEQAPKKIQYGKNILEHKKEEKLIKKANNFLK